MSEPFRFEKHKDGIGVLTFDLPDEKVNKFSTPAMEAFSAMIDDLEKEDAVRALLLVSGKPNIFIAGADVNEIKQINDEELAYRVLREGQQIFERWSQLPFPTIAVIDGACMGGGTELSLACSYRLVTDNPKTKMALPEVNLGIFPGWGGTQRLPRLIGLPIALDMILTGRSIDGKRAWKYGLADKLIPKEWVNESARSFANEIAGTKTNRYLKRRKGKTVLERSPAGRALIFSKAKKTVLKKTQGHYPAPLKAITAIRKGYRKPIAKGLEIEAQYVAPLIRSPIAKNLISIFFWTEAIKKENGVDNPEITPAEIKQVGLLGAGVMGGGIAQLMANRGIDVRIKDIEYQAVSQALKQASNLLQYRLKRRKISRQEFTQMVHRISGTVEYSGFKNKDLVIEAVVEDLKIKRQVLKEAEDQISTETIIATNTSSLSVDAMAEVLENKERFLGMHFFNPVHRMPLVEVVRGKDTADKAAATVFKLAQTLGKTPIVVRDSPGFLVNRLLVPYMVEAISLLEEGYGIKKVDRTMERFGMPMGPIALFDEVGIDVAHKVANILQKTMGDRMADSAILDKLLKARRLGKKSGAGFYRYKNGKKAYDKAIEPFIESDKDRTNLSESDMQRRMVYPMVNEAARCLEEGVVRQPRDVDVGMIYGTGFAPFRGGLLRYADTVGLNEIAEELNTFTETFGQRFKPCSYLESMAQNNRSFYESET